MPTARADHYSVESGKTLRAGRQAAVPAQIENRTWTPNRDGGDSVLSSDFGQLPLNSWCYVGTQGLRSLLGNVPYPNANLTDGTGNIVGPWCGAAWDKDRQEMYISGGGHGDSHHCETEIIKLSLDTCRFSIEIDRQPLSVDWSFDESDQTFKVTNPPLFPGYNFPLQNGVPSAVHTYGGLIHLPGSVWGNTRGAIVMLGVCRSVFDLDTHEYKTPSWWSDQANTSVSNSWPDVTAVYYNGSIYRLWNAFFVMRYQLSGTQATTWSPNSFGVVTNTYAQTTKFSATSSKIFFDDAERGQSLSLCARAGHYRTRYKAAVDAGAEIWDSYMDAITLTSSDGSHLDFNEANMEGGGNINTVLAEAGVHYDFPTDTLFIVPNQMGYPMYRMTGIDAGNTWTVTKMASSTAPLHNSVNGTYGRFRVAVRNGKLIGIRVSGATTPAQIIRLS